jgi:hypothetical protein
MWTQIDTTMRSTSDEGLHLEITEMKKNESFSVDNVKSTQGDQSEGEKQLS